MSRFEHLQQIVSLNSTLSLKSCAGYNSSYFLYASVGIHINCVSLDTAVMAFCACCTDLVGRGATSPLLKHFKDLL